MKATAGGEQPSDFTVTGFGIIPGHDGTETKRMEDSTRLNEITLGDEYIVESVLSK